MISYALNFQGIWVYNRNEHSPNHDDDALCLKKLFIWFSIRCVLCISTSRPIRPRYTVSCMTMDSYFHWLSDLNWGTVRVISNSLHLFTVIPIEYGKRQSGIALEWQPLRLILSIRCFAGMTAIDHSIQLLLVHSTNLAPTPPYIWKSHNLSNG